MKKRLTLLLALVLAFSLFSGSMVIAQEEQVLNILFLTPLTLDLNDTRNASEIQLLSQVDEGLFRIFSDENGNDVLEPAGCTSYDVSEDNLTYTFHLREHYWNDGVQVTAQQYVDSITRLLDAEAAFSYMFMAEDVKNATAYYDYNAQLVAKAEAEKVQKENPDALTDAQKATLEAEALPEVKAEDLGVKALDDLTLEITLEQVTPYFVKKLANVCFFPIRLDLINSGTDGWETDFTQHAYNGPFIITEWIKEHSMVLEKNPTYWDAENVKLEKVMMTLVGELSTQALLFNQQQLDVVEANNDYLTSWLAQAEKGEIQYIAKAKPNVSYAIFNQHTGGLSGLMNNAKIRLALSLALDREEFLDLVYGRHEVAFGLIPPGLMVGDTEFRSVVEQPLLAKAAEYDSPEKLQALFQEGLAEEGKDTDLSKISLVYLTTGDSVQEKMQQEYYQQKWQEVLGITIELNVAADRSLFVDERNNNKYDLLNNGWNGDYSDPMTFIELWITDSGYARFFGGYHNEEYDTLFASLKAETDEAKRLEIYAALEKNLVADNAGMAPLYFADAQFFLQNYVKNFSTPMFGAQYEFSRAYIEK